MKLCGGYDIKMAGRPAVEIESPVEPKELFLPRFSCRFRFSELCIGDGQHVRRGQVLARDPGNHGVPLLAPRDGTAHLDLEKEHIVLRGLSANPPEALETPEAPAHISRELGSVGMKRYKLLTLGAWQYMFTAHNGALPDPFGSPQAVLVSTLRLDPFLARGDIQMKTMLSNFTRGLEQLQSLLEYQPIYLVLPKVATAFAEQVREAVRGYAYIKPVQVPLRYPFDHFKILAKALGLSHDDEHPTWALRVGGILAMDRSLTMSLPCDTKVISIGGSGAIAPTHLTVMPGYPIKELLSARIAAGPVRIINGGALTGQAIGPEQLGIDVECAGLTLLSEHVNREFLGFVRPGSDRRSYSRCFLSALRRPMPERMTTAVRGERRPCVACGFCEEVCPVGIMPHLLHKLIYQNDLDAVERARLDLCIACGLCSFVCPSKIALGEEFRQTAETIRQEHQN
jgi:Na(+)-translocating NADH:ubiquinone oxidoreductase A subunit